MTQPAQRRKSWNPWPVSLVVFLVFALLSSIGFVVFCSLHPAELVAKDYYDQEIRYQSQLDRINNTRATAPEASVGYDAATQAIIISLPQAHVAAQPTGTIDLYRPSASGLDRKLPLQVDNAGNQHVDARSLLPGLWKVRVLWRAGAAEYFMDQSVVVVSGKG